jgi:putative peptidoglycan lipid II flippase
VATPPGEPESVAPGPAPAEPGLRSTFGLTLLSALTFLLALATQWAVIVYLGAEARTDALFASLVIPQTLLSIFSVSLGNVLVPLFAGEDAEESRRHAWSLFFSAVAIFGVLGAILALTAAYWVPVLFPGLKSELAVELARIQLLTLVMGAGAGVLSASLQARRKFAYPELAQTVGQAASLTVLALTVSTLGATGGAWAYVARSFVHLGLLCAGVGLSRPAWPGKGLIDELWRRWKPLLAGSSFYKTELLVDSFLSSLSRIPGTLSLYYLGQRLYGSALEVVRKGFAEPILPVLSLHARRGDVAGFRRLYRRRIVLILTFLLPAYGLLVIAGEPALRALIGRGGITPENVHTLWLILVTLGGVFLAGSTGQVVSFAWYALGETRVPTLIGVLGFAAAIAMKVVGFWKFGIVGIALGASIHYVGNGLVLYLLLELRTGWRTRPA